MLNKPLADSYRCAEQLCSFTLASELPTTPGYFRFGEETVCYGRSLGASNQLGTSRTRDAYQDVRINDLGLVLPFDPNEVIENLRFERYVAKTQRSSEQLLHNAYYSIRPILPVALRKYMQRLRLNGSQNKAFPTWPLDSTVERVLEKLLALSLRAQGRMSAPFVWFWPHGLPSCAIITHDVETSAGLEFCPALMDIDESFGIKSSFQLVPEKRYVVSDEILRSIRDRGFEINVHDLNHDGHLYSDRDEFLRRATKINQYARRYGAQGFRAGAMYRNLDWYEALDFSYDMSVPSVGNLEAQAGGACTIRPYFIGSMVELPLTTTQDYTLFHILGDYSIDLWKHEIDKIIEKNGLVSFIVHPDYVMEKRAQETYRWLLGYLAQLRSEGKLWICLPGEAASWWRDRSEMKPVLKQGGWDVQSDERNRACVAHAFVDDDALAYRW